MAARDFTWNFSCSTLVSSSCDSQGLYLTFPFGVPLSNIMFDLDILSLFLVPRVKSGGGGSGGVDMGKLLRLSPGLGIGLRSEATEIIVCGSIGPLLILEAGSGGEAVGENRV